MLLADELAGSTVVVIDLLRATSTICQALASGASEVVPFLEIDETLAAAAERSARNVVLGGERQRQTITGFDLGNSPSEYTPAVRRRPPRVHHHHQRHAGPRTMPGRRSACWSAHS